MSTETEDVATTAEQESPFTSREERLTVALERMGALVDRRGKELEQLRAERDALTVAIADVRRLCNLTIAASCRMQAIDQARDTLAVLDRALDTPTDMAGTTGDYYIHVTYGPWDSSGHQCGDLVAGGCDEPVPARLVTVHSVDGERVMGSELGDCPNRCHAALDAPQRPEDTAERPEHMDRHGRTWDPHPFVQSRASAADNPHVCICGRPPGHRVHNPEDARTGVSAGERRCSFGCRLIPGETAADHERDEHTTCAECGSEPIGRYPVAHKTSCSRMTIGPHLWPSVSAEGDERG